MNTSVLNSPKAEGRKRQSENTLKQLALSIHNYHDVQVRFPAANFIGRNGHPHSWRTGMLPFLDQGDPYYDYRLKETWNGPTIAKVFRKIPDVCRHLDATLDTVSPWHLALNGQRTGFSGEKTSFTNLIDDSSNTIMFASGRTKFW